MATRKSEIERLEEPSRLDTFRLKWPWLDHLVRAGKRYKGKQGDYFGAGITYFSVFAFFPLAMVTFSVLGFVLYYQPEWLDSIKEQIADRTGGGSLGTTISDLMDKAISSRAAVGVVGLLGALWSGLGWMANLRAALTFMWDAEEPSSNFVKSKLGDLAALIGLGLAFIATIAVMVFGSSDLIRKAIDAAGFGDIPGLVIGLRVVSLLFSILASWLLWTYVIAKLPRIQFPLGRAKAAGLLTAIGFTIFLQVATFLIAKTVSGPAGATFGPVLGVMLFIFFTMRIVLFFTAWAATDPKNQVYKPPSVPDPVVISPQIIIKEPSGASNVAFLGAGVLTGLGISRLRGK